MYWNKENPRIIGNYICDLGAYGISLAWWNGSAWIKMWGNEEVVVYGWIQIPKYNL